MIGRRRRRPARGGIATLTQNAQFYEQVAPIYDELYEEIDVEEAVRQWALLLMRSANLPRRPQRGPMPRMLDLGCGTGRYLAPWAAAGFSVTGADASRRMISIARSRIRRPPSNSSIQVLHGDVRQASPLLVKNGPYDVAVAHFNFFNLFPPDEISRILRTLASCMNADARLFTDCASPALLPTARRERRRLPGGGVVDIRTRPDVASATVVRMYRHRDSEFAEKYWLHSNKALRAAAAPAGWRLETSYAWRPDLPQTPWFPWRRDAARQRVCVFRLGD